MGGSCSSVGLASDESRFAARLQSKTYGLGDEGVGDKEQEARSWQYMYLMMPAGCLGRALHAAFLTSGSFFSRGPSSWGSHTFQAKPGASRYPPLLGYL